MGYMAGMTSNPTPDDQPDETPGGSTITDPEVFHDPADNDESGNTDNMARVGRARSPDTVDGKSVAGRLCRVMRSTAVWIGRQR